MSCCCSNYYSIISIVFTALLIMAPSISCDEVEAAEPSNNRPWTPETGNPGETVRIAEFALSENKRITGQDLIFESLLKREFKIVRNGTKHKIVLSAKDATAQYVLGRFEVIVLEKPEKKFLKLLSFTVLGN